MLKKVFFILFILGITLICCSKNPVSIIVYEKTCLDGGKYFLDESNSLITGTVYVDGYPKAGVDVILEGKNVWKRKTDEKGVYEFKNQRSGHYSIQACWEDHCNRGPDCDGNKTEFYLLLEDTVNINLCIGKGGPCPYALCQ